MGIINPLKYFMSKKVGLALGSGGARGLSHISVIRYIENMGIPIHKIAGSSIGAIVGASYACGTIEKLKNDALSITRKELFSIFDLTFPTSGLLKGDGLIRFLEKYIPKDALLEDLPVELSVLATDYYSGRSVIFNKGPVLDAVRASISIPGVFVPVPYRKTYLVDGGVANPLPVETVKMMGADLTIAVNLHPGLKTSGFDRFLGALMDRKGFNLYSDDRYFAGEAPSMNVVNVNDSPAYAYKDGMSSGSEHWFSEKKKEGVDAPNIFEIMLQSIDIMEIANTRNILVHNRPTVLIEPELLNIGTLDFDSIYRIITEGYRACSKVCRKLNRRVKVWF